MLIRDQANSIKCDATPDGTRKEGGAYRFSEYEHTDLWYEPFVLSDDAVAKENTRL